ncbi:MAG TPA: hypothetical protein VLW51_09320 [Solirubrobacteraceae bacterium]|nr:hypothetical protein [Solirubrobacteraceae bacterium]
MKPWMLPWLFPVGLLGAVVFVAVFNGFAALLLVPLAWIVLPVVWRIANPPGDDPDADVHYWRLPRTPR